MGERLATIYALCDSRISDPILRVRYIGQTFRELDVRLGCHWRSARFGNTEHRAAWMRSMERAGAAVLIVPIKEHVAATDADLQEIEQIARFRALGCDLTNRTDGGYGHKGKFCTAETRKKMSESARRRIFTPEWRAKMIAGIRASAKVRANLDRIHRFNCGKPKSIEHREAISAALRGEANGKHILTWESVGDIRSRYDAGIRQSELVKAFGVSPATIHRIVHNHGWVIGSR